MSTDEQDEGGAGDRLAAGDHASPARQGIASVEIATRVLLTLERGAGPMSLAQIADLSDMPPGKVHRYLVSLGRAGLVARSPTSGRYDLGPSLRRLGAEALRRMDEVSLTSEHLPALRDRTGHAVNLSVWGDHGPVVVRWDYGAHPLPITIRVGASMPLLASAVGKVFLAYLPATITMPVLRSQHPAGEPESGLWERVEWITAKVHRDGAATVSDSLIPGVASIAAPVFSSGSSLPLVVALALPTRHATTEAMNSLSVVLRTATAAMSAELGYRQAGQPALPDAVAADR